MFSELCSLNFESYNYIIGKLNNFVIEKKSKQTKTTTKPVRGHLKF